MTESELLAHSIHGHCPELAAEVRRLQEWIHNLQALNVELCDKYAAQSAALTRAAEIHAEKQREIDQLRNDTEGLRLALKGRCDKIIALEAQVRVLTWPNPIG